MARWGPTTAIPSTSALNAVSHSSSLRRTISYSRLLASTTDALVATVERSQRSSVVNAPPLRSATARAPIVIPWARSGATAADRTILPPIRSTVGVSTPWATSMRSRRLARAGGGHHPEHLPTFLREDHHRAVGLQKSGCISGDLVHHAVQLNRFGEDVAQLLQRKQLTDAPIYLDRELVGLNLRLAGPLPRPQQRQPKGSQDCQAGPQGDPPHPMLGPPRHDGEKNRARNVQRQFPASPPQGQTQEYPGDNAQGDTQDQRRIGDDAGGEDGKEQSTGRDCGHGNRRAKRATRQFRTPGRGFGRLVPSRRPQAAHSV